MQNWTKKRRRNSISGHTDVVPTDGQNWTSNPFNLTMKNNKYYGRGTADMKGFIAVVLSLLKKIKNKRNEEASFSNFLI